MKQLLQYFNTGATRLAEAPTPCASQGKVTIQTTRSLVSAGTERMLVDFGKAGWIGKAKQQPEKVRAVLNKVRSEGALATWRAVRAKLDHPIALGYCCVGRVVAVGDGDRGMVISDWGGVTAGRLNNTSPCPESETLPITIRQSRITDNQPPITTHHSPLTHFRIGDRVVSSSPHAEVVSAPFGMCAKIPDTVSDEAATFTPLAAIAWEGIGLLSVQPGDRVVVTGLGLIGQLAVRILHAIGCEVLGFDPTAERRKLAEEFGVRTVATGDDPVAAAMAWTKGAGVAGVLITASTPSNEIVSNAARSCRFRGKVVLVGVVGLQLNRADFYKNEVSFQVSCSYGRRDPRSPHSAQANFQQVLAWMAEGKLPVEDLITHRFKFEDAPRAYDALSDRSALGILLEYGRGVPRSSVDGDDRLTVDSGDRLSVDGKDQLSVVGGDQSTVKTETRGPENRPQATDHRPPTTDHRSSPTTDLLARTIVLRQPSPTDSPIHVALIGAGNFAARTLMPALATVKPTPTLSVVVSNQGVSAVLLAEKFGGLRASTDETAAFDVPGVQAVFITSRHDDHAAQAIVALRAGKHVWVEKPLCLTIEELAAVEKAVCGDDQLSVDGGGSVIGGNPNASAPSRNPQTLPRGPLSPITDHRSGPITDHRSSLTTDPHRSTPILMLGFNRRFAPMATALRAGLQKRGGAIQVKIMVNAGRLDSDHWTLDPRIGGGRIVGEGCHFVDLSRYLVGSPIKQVSCTRRDADGQDGGCFSLMFDDGSTAEVDYRTDLPAHLPKEVIDVSGNGFSARISNWVKLTSSGLGGLSKRKPFMGTPQKGHPEALRAFLAAVQGGPAPIPVEEIFEVSRWAIVMQSMQAGKTQQRER